MNMVSSKFNCKGGYNLRLQAATHLDIRCSLYRTMKTKYKDDTTLEHKQFRVLFIGGLTVKVNYLLHSCNKTLNGGIKVNYPFSDSSSLFLFLERIGVVTDCLSTLTNGLRQCQRLLITLMSTQHIQKYNM